MHNVVIIGAGIGGLTAAAMLARQGHAVTVLEAHVYAGGCAGTFYYQGYRFDAGATLAGGFNPGGPMDRLAALLEIDWPATIKDRAMTVHLADGRQVDRWGTDARWQARRAAFGPQGEPFWRWQEATADAMWSLSDHIPAWPPQSPQQGLSLAGTALRWVLEDPPRRLDPRLLKDAFGTVSEHLKGAPEALRQFVDGQLLIAAQTTSQYSNALYGAAALDLPRRGVAYLAGGMGRIAEELVQALQRHGGQVIFRQEATRIRMENGRPVAVETKRGDSYPADLVIANLPPTNIKKLVPESEVPPPLRGVNAPPHDGWGAFMVYIGLDGQAVNEDLALHHQILSGPTLGEANSVFISMSPSWDLNRGPIGKRALTLSTHTERGSWWDFFHTDRQAYEARKEIYTRRMLDLASRVIPDLREAAELVLPGTPITFQRFTRRIDGWVGGFPQTSLFRAWGPRLAPGLWMVGDSIFPGQSTTAVAMGGLRVAEWAHQEVQSQPKRLRSPGAKPPYSQLRNPALPRISELSFPPIGDRERAGRRVSPKPHIGQLEASHDRKDIPSS